MGEAFELAIDTLMGIKERLDDMVPYGPNRQKVTRTEFRQVLAKMTGNERLLTAQRMGMSKFLEGVNAPVSNNSNNIP